MPQIVTSPENTVFLIGRCLKQIEDNRFSWSNFPATVFRAIWYRLKLSGLFNQLDKQLPTGVKNQVNQLSPLELMLLATAARRLPFRRFDARLYEDGALLRRLKKVA